MDNQNSTGASGPCHCRRCGAQFEWERARGRRGRPPLCCSEICRKGLKAHDQANGVCAVCGSDYVRRADRLGSYCSRACKDKRKREQRPTKPAMVDVSCCGCGETRQRKTWHKGAGDTGDSLRYCTMRCYHAATSRVSREKAALGRIAAAWNRRERDAAIQAKRLLAREVAALRRIAAYVERPSTLQALCPCCEQMHVVKRGMGRRSRLCSPCALARLAKQKRVAKARRRARKRSTRVESIDPIAVFEAEGWLCYLCGVMTDKAKRGTWHPLAPELEHVVPLSKGGTHTRENVRCACRRCNGLKADSLPAAA